MELTYLNPVGLVTPNISMWRGGGCGRVRTGSEGSAGGGGLWVWAGRSLTASPSSSWAVLSIDRMEHPSPSRGTRRYPRYHSNLFRGQDAWDPHTHVLLPSQAPRLSPHDGECPGVTLGRALFPQPDPTSPPAGPLGAPPSSARPHPGRSTRLAGSRHLEDLPRPGPGRPRSLRGSCAPTPGLHLQGRKPHAGCRVGLRAGFVGAQGRRSLTAAPPRPPAVLPTGGSGVENSSSQSVAPPPPALEPEPEPGTSIVTLLVYRTLGGLLPAQFQAERRGARYGGWGGRCQAPHPELPAASTQPSPPTLFVGE